MKFGVEIEVYLLEKSGSRIYVNREQDIIDFILENTDERVYRDYYRYQIELRSKPRKRLEDCFLEVIDLYNQVKELLRDTNYFIVPLSYLPERIVSEEIMFNGMHIHISSNNIEELIDRVFALYPYLLVINRLCHSSPYKTFSSVRMIQSPHIALVRPSKYREKICSDDRYYDITLNYNSENSRHRLKDCTTIEIRLFDTPAILELNLELLRRFANKLTEAVYTISTNEAKDIIERIIELEKINIMSQIRYFSACKINIDSIIHSLEYIYRNTPIEYDDLIYLSCDFPITYHYSQFYKTVISKCIS